MDERPDHADRLDGGDRADDDLWSEALWSAGLIGSVLGVIAVLAQFA